MVDADKDEVRIIFWEILTDFKETIKIYFKCLIEQIFKVVFLFYIYCTFITKHHLSINIQYMKILLINILLIFTGKNQFFIE